jgi:hypothetical protein
LANDACRRKIKIKPSTSKEKYMKKMKPLFGTAMAFLLATAPVWGQPATQLSAKPPALLPPSPDAFQFARYGNLPIGTATGAAQFNLPIYTVRSGGLSHSVSIGYSTNGVKVDEQAGRTGLGWSLRAGGVVTRTVMDKPDGGGGGIQPTYYHGNSTPFMGNWPLYNYVRQAANQMPPDFQPDEYSFSMDGYSGKFMRREDGSFAHFNGSGVRIEQNAAGFLLTAPNGVRYCFYEAEVANNYSYPVSSTLQWVPAPAPTAWYLTKITAPNGDAIDFNYGYVNETGSHGITYTNGISQDYSTTAMSINGPSVNGDYHRIRYDGANANASPGCPNMGNLGTTVQLTGNTPRSLRSIVFPGGMVRFSYSGRDDAPGEQKLDSVQVFRNGDGQRLACTVLGYTYSHAAPGPFDTQIAGSNYTDANPHLRKRLFLTGARELGNNGEEGPAHAFEYNDINALPPRLSFAQDRHGGFNGKANGMYFFPNDTWLDWHIGNNQFGANRGYSFAHAQKGALTKITYPTGGHTAITYGPNKIAGTYDFRIKSDSVWAVMDTSTVTGQEAWSDTIHHHGGNLRARTACSWASVPLDGAGPNGGYTGIGGSWYIAWYLVDVATNNCVKICGGALYPGTQGVNGHLGFGLAPGVYRIKMVASLPNLRGRISLERWERVANHGPDAGIAGIRVQKITDYTDSGRVAGGRSYLYSNWGDSTASSGTGLRSENGHNGAEIGFAEVFDGNTTCGYNTIGSNSVASNFLTDNGTVFYTKVVELPTAALGEAPLATPAPNAGAVAGAVEHEFYCQPKKTALPLVFDWYNGGWAATQPLPTTPGAPLMNNDFLTGMPRATRTFTFNALHGPRTLVNETVNHYSVDTANLAIDTFLVSRYARPMPENNNPLLTEVPPQYQTFFYHYDIYRYWRYFGHARLDSTVTRDYSGALPMEGKTVYSFYSPKNFQPRQIGYTASNGNTKTILRRYAGDIMPYEPGHATIYNPMVNANMVDALVEETVLENGNEMAKTRTGYGGMAAPGNGIQYLPLAVYAQRGTATEKQQLQYQLYDSTGNLLQYTDKGGVVTSILWGYGGRYPVAQLTGIGHADAVAQSGIDLALLNSPGSEAALRTELAKLRGLTGAQVLTRTYYPLVGVASQTGIDGRTVYYQYDGFNRLQVVKDQEGNVVKMMEEQFRSGN